MQKSTPAFIVGATVAVRGESWRVRRVERFACCTLLSLQGVDAANQGESLRVVSPFDRPQVRTAKPPLRIADRSTCLAFAARAVADAHPWRGLWSAARASLDLFSWQLEPALAVVNGATRVLLADGVGLGKTIQAGLILAELRARGLVERALVLTPAGLRAQWRGELRERFDIDAVELDQPTLARALAALPIGANPWATAPVIVSSIDLVKRPEHLAALEHVSFDVLIVDEAHHVTPGTERGAVVARLASTCPWTVLVTATPHSGDVRSFTFLQSVGATRTDRLMVFRRLGPEVSCRSRRRTRFYAVQPSAAEAAMLAGVDAYARAIWRARGSVDESARLVATVIARRAASSAAALVRTLERRRLLARGGAEPRQSPLPWEEVDERDDVESAALLRVAGLDDPEMEGRELDRLIAVALAARASASKAHWLSRFVRRLREPVVVFSEYRDTIEDLVHRFPDHGVALLHGGLSLSERRAATRAFVEGHIQILLATDAAGEGLNLHARCRTVINLELPWNPVRLEQRVGRVDRLGQHRTVHAAHLFHRDSIEDRVLASLHRRLARATAAGGLSSMVGAAAVRAVAECAFGDGAAPELSTVDLRTAPNSAALRETDRLATCRSLRTLMPPWAREREHGEHVALVAPLRHERVRRLTCLFEATAIDHQDCLVARYVCALVATVDPPRYLTRQTARDVFASLARNALLRAAAVAAAETRLREDSKAAAGTSTAWHARFQSLAAATTSRPAFFQSALFDTRAQRAAAGRAAQRAARVAYLERRALSVAALEHVRLSGPPTLIAVWPSDISTYRTDHAKCAVGLDGCDGSVRQGASGA
ncbi:MAG: helicase-related protein [Vicinamibacterales bacterium]